MPWDGMFITLAILDAVCVAGMGLVALSMLRTGRRVGGRVTPAVSHARRSADSGRRLALKARDLGRQTVEDARELVGRVRKRLDTTRHLVRELKPPEAVDTRALIRNAQATVAQSREWAGRLRRLQRAGRTASNKNSAPPSQG